jgi:hypothetical protein
MVEDIRLYCGLSERAWSGVPVDPGKYACVSPISGRSQRTKRENCVSVPKGTEVIQDSGAFSDSWSQRLTFEQALSRQLAHAEKYGYADKITYRATYDLLIDEVWSDGNRFKRRWSAAQAEDAVDTTVNAAAWMDDHRDEIPLAISAQGVDAPQYLRCIERLIPFFKHGDILGLGGWCIIGKMSRQMMPVFEETVDLIFPFIKRQGIPSVHIWGVIYPPALAYLSLAAHQYDISVSTDSAGVNLNPVRGQWGYGSWRDNRYIRPNGNLLGLDRVRHTQLTREWLANFHQSHDMARVTLCRDGHNVTLSRPGNVSPFSHGDDVTLYGQKSTAAKCDTSFPTCIVCGKIIIKRSHAKTCGERCRKRLSRQSVTHHE